MRTDCGPRVEAEHRENRAVPSLTRTRAALGTRRLRMLLRGPRRYLAEGIGLREAVRGRCRVCHLLAAHPRVHPGRRRVRHSACPRSLT